MKKLKKTKKKKTKKVIGKNCPSFAAVVAPVDRSHDAAIAERVGQVDLQVVIKTKKKKKK